MTLAQIPTLTTGTIEAWLICAGIVVLIALNTKKLFQKIPPDHQQYANRTETEKRFEIIEKKIEAVRIEQRTQYDELMRAGEQRKEEIFERINAIHDDINKRISEIGIRQSNDIGELRGELRRIS